VQAAEAAVEAAEQKQNKYQTTLYLLKMEKRLFLALLELAVLEAQAVELAVALVVTVAVAVELGKQEPQELEQLVAVAEAETNLLMQVTV
jgi:hypothetical protein